MLDYKIVTTDEYERLVKFFVINQLEFDGDEEVDTDIVKCWKMTTGEDDLIGGAVLAIREDKYIIDGIAVDEKYRSFKLGTKLLDCVKKEVKSRGGDSIYLVARAPGFFKTQGFITISHESGPNFFECKYCPQFNKSCFPEVMKYNIE